MNIDVDFEVNKDLLAALLTTDFETTGDGRDGGEAGESTGLNAVVEERAGSHEGRECGGSKGEEAERAHGSSWMYKRVEGFATASGG